MSLATPVLRQAQRVPRQTAIATGDGDRVSYGQLARRVDELVAQLRSQGHPPGSRIALLLPSSPRFLEVMLAVADAGMCAMVLDPTWSDRELRQALHLGQSQLVVTDATNRARIAALDSTPITELDQDRPVRQAMAGGVTSEDAPFLLGFTSGSTGMPKGFLRSHRSWLASLAVAQPILDIREGEQVILPGPLQHTLFLYGAFHGLALGATIQVSSRFRPQQVLRLLGSARSSHVFVVPTMLAAILAAASAGGHQGDPDMLRSVISSGARWPVDVQDEARSRFPGVELVDVYGASELSFVSYRRVRPGDHPRTVGTTFEGVEVVARDEAGNDLPPGQPGLLWVRSDLLFSGYLGDALPVAAERSDDRWCSVGDVGYRAEDGSVHLVGRNDAMFVSGGRNVFPEEIERVFEQLPQVLRAAVVSIPDPAWGELPCLLVECRAGGAVTRRELRAHARRHLGPGKRPRRWLRTSALPLTRNGKLARDELVAAWQAGTLAYEEIQ